MSLRAEPQSEFDPSTITVLVVDDHAYMRAIIAEVLRGAGIGRIIGASNGVEALDEIEAYQPDVVITDWGMDCMDGYELARAIRASTGPSRQMPIIMMSGDTRRSQIDLARASGVDEFIAKPVSGQKIMSRLRQVIRHPRQFVESPAYNGPCRRRIELNYAGPLRRLSDPIEPLPHGADLKEEQQRVVTACIERVHDMTLDFDPGDRLQARAIYNGANEANAVASESSDKHLARATKSLLRYLQGAGATERLQADVVGTHLDAIQKIVALPASQAAERELLAAGLERVVSKKLRPVEAA
jgi:CheY-like chemotaxis protein